MLSSAAQSTWRPRGSRLERRHHDRSITRTPQAAPGPRHSWRFYCLSPPDPFRLIFHVPLPYITAMTSKEYWRFDLQNGQGNVTPDMKDQVTNALAFPSTTFASSIFQRLRTKEVSLLHREQDGKLQARTVFEITVDEGVYWPWPCSWGAFKIYTCVALIRSSLCDYLWIIDHKTDMVNSFDIIHGGCVVSLIDV